ncbi:hypothetical protein K502DRAFT_327067 [Neoconidiobolus thromboides FSU 785]|nr:hypothetical protein K502DRAFT_327067 [Neoconidiobolus thromboides FSU 785]
MSLNIIKHHIKLLQLDLTLMQFEELLAQTQGYYNNLKAKVTQRDRNGANCRPAICLHLALKSLHLPVDTRALCSISGTTRDKYRKALIEYSKILNLQMDIDFYKLCVKYGDPSLVDGLEKDLEYIKEDKKMKKRIEDMDINLVKLALFYIICEENGIRVDKDQLLKEVYATSKGFLSLIKEVKFTLSKKERNEVIDKAINNNNQVNIDDILNKNKNNDENKNKKRKLVPSPFLNYHWVS